MSGFDVGITFSPGQGRFLEAVLDLLDIVEIEPQTYWMCSEAGQARIEPEVLEALVSLPRPKVLHSVGLPVANASFDAESVALLRTMAERLGCEYFSEHLAFNRAALAGRGEVFAGFLLPPSGGAREAERIGRNARALAEAVGLPIALETAVNYLRAAPGELSDGEFVARTVEAAGAGILLDLHNVWTNERNGRQSVAAFIDSLPLDRVWEIHLADGIDLDGFWLDAHSGLPQPRLIELLAELLPRLPNLRNVVFELLPQHTAALDVDAARRFLGELRGLRSPGAARPALVAPAPRSGGRASGERSAHNDRLARAILEPGALDGDDLVHDRGVALYRGLIRDVRFSQIVHALPETTRAACSIHGPDAFEAWLAGFCERAPASPFPAEDALGFAQFLGDVPGLVPAARVAAAAERAAILAALAR